ncbi:uncharacterized protein EI97DRAFT_418108 [Westerdykella ornata]|uniref:DUF8021 domain-containing protein n=1 Tax=Westerdykella ornata TaxID=318751 RepID=A0A6A6JID2_WESOR|nr:uncharacterized protein EI97DRAFT_418108 [Westerdykella ornata]KAF2276321.1 hypothetical protein EI97DRAFT_418108 [Westerdykella ornata]
MARSLLLGTSLVLSLLLPSTSCLPHAASSSSCTKALLTEAANAYLVAQTQASLSPLQPYLSPNWTYTENNVVLTNPTKGLLLRKPLALDHNRTIHDLVQCATYTEAISTQGPYVFGTQLRFSPRSDGKIVIDSIDTIASTTGSWLFNATKTLAYVRQELEAGGWREILPESKRDTREAIKAAGDAYLDMWSDARAHERVPWGTPCVRLEGSAYTGKGLPTDSCTPGIPSNHSQPPNTHRRYVIDEAMGSVSIFCVWEHMMNAADSHEFRLEGGKLRYVHTMTECGGKVCKL